MSQDILKAIEIHRRNLEAIEVQKAQFGIAVPVELENAARWEAEEIRRLQNYLNNHHSNRRLTQSDVLTGISAQLTVLGDDMDTLRREVQRELRQLRYHFTALLNVSGERLSRCELRLDDIEKAIEER
ncbi:MAG: hypothetical protein QHJ81_14770 [Anaerolineae bacterium]|nr:hypothetical protein [Anaerolineae bacterium]